MSLRDSANTPSATGRTRAHVPLRGAALLATLTGSLLWPVAPTAFPTTLAPLDLEQLTTRASAVVRARVAAVAARGDARGIWTLTTFERLESWKGSAPARLVVRMPGGAAGGLRERVEGVPRFTPGEEVVLFLEPLPAGEWTIAGWVQGTYRIRRDARSGVERAIPDAAGRLLLGPRSSSYRPAVPRLQERTLPVAELRAQVTRYVQEESR